MAKERFENSARPISEQELKKIFPFTKDFSSFYLFQDVSPYMFLWQQLFQKIVSMVGTKLLTNEWHPHGGHGIFKYEGGCEIAQRGSLVLYKERCCFESYRGPHQQKDTKAMADLITRLVLEWDPENAVESFLATGANAVGVDATVLRQEIENHATAFFPGDALHSFFNHNGFEKFAVSREYQRFCYLKYDGITDADVDQKFSDEDLGEQLLTQIRNVIRKRSKERFPCVPHCCTPRRDQGGLKFWINTGVQTAIDGWKTLEEIEAFLESPMLDQTRR